MLINQIEYADNEVILSIGYLRPRHMRAMLETSPVYIEAYEPRDDIYQSYLKFKSEQFRPIHAAVMGKTGRVKVLLCSKKSKTRVIYDKKGGTQCVALATILRRIHRKYGRIDRLLINCEGSEYDIIKDTSIKEFGLCKYISIQFHHWMENVPHNYADTKSCISKFVRTYSIQCLSRKYGKYTLTRRRNE